ncbi:HAD family hydrolase [Azoarcus sp. L1K30]|uniref:HAD-IIIC family phosphatase n=1 Tax=Azoarcus sp. L1K30 TaxID=2820277 RepID=UPI001B843129|nr:HAD-IIIC family phosphatase [Azoarcus sp. L1K30]MBR0566025.1 HAD family hydrolase [Azoarcus sp. L1K30]
MGNGDDARQLSTHALDLTQLGQLARSMRRLTSLAPLTPFKLAILGSATVDFLIEPLVASGARYGLALEVFGSPFGQVMQQALDPHSDVMRFDANAVLLYLDYRFFKPPQEIGNPSSLQAAVDEAIEQTNSLRQSLRQSGATVIVTTMPPPPLPLFGHLDARVAGTGRAFAESYNTALIRSLSHTSDILLDAAALAATVGLATWHDAPQWLVAKIPFSMDCVPLFADHVSRIVASMMGKARKCLVLDLDNTLWGGVIGDDGLEGIEIGNGSATGEAHLELQRAALALRQRGIVLAVSSKNNDDVARKPFREHPDMLLREEHIAVFQANWQDKATNLVAIAKSLNIGVDALVFLDDNPAERALVRQALPQVAVCELPKDPALYPEVLMQAGYFEALAFSEEDRLRAGQYQSNGARAALEQAAADLSTYLHSLQMVIAFSPFDVIGQARIAQLINKSNQFNLTTRRYSETDIESIRNDPALFTLQARLTDRFGDNGMISVVICRPEGQHWSIDTWLMSCRVLKRHVELAVLDQIMAAASEKEVREVRGRYLPTEKNDLVRNHYEELGFTQICAHEDGTTEWRMNVAGYQAHDLPMVIKTSLRKAP